MRINDLTEKLDDIKKYGMHCHLDWRYNDFKSTNGKQWYRYFNEREDILNQLNFKSYFEFIICFYCAYKVDTECSIGHAAIMMMTIFLIIGKDFTRTL